MSIRYKTPVGIAPFIVAPAEGVLQQRLMVAPHGAIPYADAFTNRVSQFTLSPRIQSRVIAQVVPFREFVVIAFSVQTDAEEDFSSRAGVSVTFGALVPVTVLKTPRLCERIQGAIEQYFRWRFDCPLSVESVTSILSAGSIDAERWNVDLLVRSFQETFGLSSPRAWYPKGLQKYVGRWRLRRLEPLRPMATTAELMAFWRVIDDLIARRPDVRDVDVAVRRDLTRGSNVTLGLMAYLSCLAVIAFALYAPNVNVEWRALIAAVAALSAITQLVLTLRDAVFARDKWIRAALTIALPIAVLTATVALYVVWVLASRLVRSP